MNVEANLENYLDDDVELTSETDHGGIIIPKQTCEHVQYVELFEKLNHINNQFAKKSIQNPSTIIAIQDLLLSDELEKTDLLSYCYTIKVRSASIDELVCLHSSDYVNMIVSAEKNHLDTSNNHFQIEYNETTFSNARFSAGITIDVIQNALDKHMNGFILITSPGHRASRDHGNGTSIYNNIALGINSILMEKIKPNKRKNSLTLFDTRNRSDMQGATPIENAICHMIHVLSPASITDYPIDSNISTITDNNNNNNIQIERVLIINLTCEHGCGIQSIYYESDQFFDEHHYLYQ
ncbi:unnamed protein product [Rotaria sp. Silwood2]|nr:unnamed protein product [Rotaria sp. Silwood2]